MANVVKTKIMKNHRVPVIIAQLFWYMSSHIVVNLSKVLILYSANLFLSIAIA